MARRGTEENPVNRFERIALEPDPEADAEPAPAPATRFFADPTRAILAHNESPDVGFDTSVNPYRGCEHGCIYCLAPETPVLHADMSSRPLGEVRAGDELVGFDELVPPDGGERKLRPAVVQAVWWSRKPTLRLVTRNGEVVTTAEHRWLQARDFRWSRTDQLSPGRELGFITTAPLEAVDEDYRAGYVAGLTLGGGTHRFEPGPRSDRLGFPTASWRVALADPEPLGRFVDYLGEFGIDAKIRAFDPGPSARKPMAEVEIRSLHRLETLHELVTVERSSRAWRRGFVAGFFDAAGHDGGSLRMSQVDVFVLERVCGYARSLGFDLRLESREGRASSLRLIGATRERIRFFAVCRPAIRGELDAIFGRIPALPREPVEAIEQGPVRDVIDIQTSTGTFFAGGLATHNCYARPFHEYLGFSAGLDFETRILVKRDAPALLRKALAAPGWRPRVIALSGVTDAYQPVERRLRITRGCLEVLAEFRNPVAIVTKSRLVARDADLLAQLAAVGAASVHVSLTTLDPALQRAMEPRASAPRERLRAIEALAGAGVPAGVMVGPVIPGLTDHELPAILAAAASAGAGFASHVVLRLPHGVAALFEAWLERHFPDRKAKVLNRIRAVRGGRTNDPRFGSRMRGEGPWAEQIHALFELGRRRAGLAPRGPTLSIAAFRRPGGAQIELF